MRRESIRRKRLGRWRDTNAVAYALLLRHLEALEVRMLKDLALYLSTITAGFGIGVRELPRELRDQPIHVVDAREELLLVSRFVETSLVVYVDRDADSLRGVEQFDDRRVAFDEVFFAV